MKILKFGGKSIATTERFRAVADIVINKNKGIIVIPAIPEITAKLEDISDYLYKKNIEGASEVINELKKSMLSIVDSLQLNPQSKEKAETYINNQIFYIQSFGKALFTLFEERIVLAQGELFSSYLFFLLLKEMNVNATELSALDFMRIDKNAEPDSEYIKNKLTKLLQNNRHDTYITQGYICKNAYGEIDDFRKGGNDYTATLIGAAIDASEIQIWMDIDRMYNIDPTVVKQSGIIDNLSFNEAAELAYFGDKVLHPTSILPAKLANIPVRILSILSPDSLGTLISDKAEKKSIKAVAVKDGITSIRINSGKMLLAHGFLRKIFEVFEYYQTSIDMLASSEVGISLTIDNPRHLKDITDDLKKYGIVTTDSDMSIVCIVGDLNWNNEKNKLKVLESLKEIPTYMISYGGSDYNFSFLIREKDKEQTLRILNENLFLNN